MVSRLVIALASTAAVASAGGLEAAAGRGLFDHAWVLAPSSVHAQAGLGPLYNARACASCHAGAGPGRVAEGELDTGAVVRLGDANGRADPAYGDQIQTRAAPGARPEALVRLGWREQSGRRTVAVSLDGLSHGPLAQASRASLRRAPDLAGVGLLEQVSEQEILSHAATGRPAWLGDGHGGRRLGRWGWKAAQPMLDAQTAKALERDIGISPGETPEAARKLIVAYLKSLPAPAPSPFPAGEAVFASTGCGACHATLHTPLGAPVRAYTDLLLHDLGPQLADGVGEGAAKPSQWRTAPLWSLRAELKAGGLLHDGRARSIGEAVSWHGGEAARARARYAALNDRDRQALDALLLGR